MNNMILVREGHVAHVRGFGSFGRGSRSTISELDLVTPFGFFIPANGIGARAVDLLCQLSDKSIAYTSKQINRLEEVEAGLLIDRDCRVNQVFLTDIGTLEIVPLGKRSTVIVSGAAGYSDVMAACVDLTTTIEEACEMYGKYITYSPQNLVIQPLSYYRKIWYGEYEKRNYHDFLCKEGQRAKM
jgi:hypothetical protein